MAGSTSLNSFMSDSLQKTETKQPHLGMTIAKNTAFVTMGSIALKALNFFFGVYVIRSLGDERFGQYSIVLAFVGLFQILAELGVSQYVRREMARDRNRTPYLLWNLIAIRLALAVIGVFGITAAAYAAGYSQILVLGVFIYSCSFLLSALAVPFESVLWAHERLDYNALKGVVGQIVFIVLGAFFLFSGFSFVWLIVASLISLIPQIWLAAWAIRRHNLPILPIQVDPRIWPQLIRAGLPFGLISLALTIDFSIDTVMLSRFQPEQVAGWYNVSYGLTRSLLFFFGGFSTAIVPSLSRTYAHDSASVERWYYRTVKFILLASLPVAVGGMLVATPLIQFLYTDEFLPSARALQIIIWDFPFLMFASFCGNMTTVVVEERSAARVYLISAVVNVVLNLYAIPRFSFLGAAVVTVITDLVAAVQFYFLLRGKLNLPDLKSIFFRVVLAAAIMGGVVSLARNLNLFVVIGLGVATYGSLVLALKLLDEAEWAILFRLVRRLRNHGPARQLP